MGVVEWALSLVLNRIGMSCPDWSSQHTVSSFPRQHEGKRKMTDDDWFGRGVEIGESGTSLQQHSSAALDIILKSVPKQFHTSSHLSSWDCDNRNHFRLMSHM